MDLEASQPESLSYSNAKHGHTQIQQMSITNNLEEFNEKLNSPQDTLIVKRTILDYFPRIKSTGPFDITIKKLSFFDLPLSIRRQIYNYAGLVDGQLVYLNYVVPPYKEGYGFVCPQAYTCWNSEEVPQLKSLSLYSKSISQLVDGPVSHPFIKINRLCPCGGVQDNGKGLFCLLDRDSGLYYCKCEPIPSDLIYVSPRFAIEIKSIFFLKSRFSICKHSLGGLSSLRSLQPIMLKWLGSLSIHLSCVTTHKCARKHYIPGCHPSCNTISRHKTLLKEDFADRERSELANWARLCNYLAHSVTPNRLKLCIIAEVKQIRGAEEVLASLFSLPVLRECAIFLSKRRKNYLLELAHAAVMRLTDKLANSEQASFRFMDLPLEVQLLILENTSLVVPYDLAWAVDADGEGRPRIFEVRLLDIPYMVLI